MTLKEIETIGSLLTNYRSDLNYINQFQQFKKGKISTKNYVQKNIGSFYSFLIEYRVVRNIPKGTVDKVLSETLSWVNSRNPNDVDLFAKKMNSSELTSGKLMTSLSSKILFLNNPWEIIPIDTLTRKALNQSENNYLLYKKNILKFEKRNEEAIDNILEYTNPLVNVIHQEFKQIENLHLIHRNRIIDKLLWTLGK